MPARSSRQQPAAPAAAVIWAYSVLARLASQPVHATSRVEWVIRRREYTWGRPRPSLHPRSPEWLPILANSSQEDRDDFWARMEIRRQHQYRPHDAGTGALSAETRAAALRLSS